MSQTLRKYRSSIIFLIDMIAVLGSYIFSLLIRFEFDVKTTLVYFNVFQHLILYIIVIYTSFFILFKVNKSVWKFTSIEDSIRIFLASFISNGLLFFVYSFSLKEGLPRSIFFFSVFITPGFLLGMRVFYRYLMYKGNLKARNKNALIIGAGDAGNILSKEIYANDAYNCRIVGFVDDSSFKQGRMVNGIPVLAKIDQLKEVVEKYHVDEIYIAMPSVSSTRLKEILDQCNGLVKVVKIMSLDEVSSTKKAVLRSVSIEDLLGRGVIEIDNSDISFYLADKVVMVTGGGGSIGSELVRQILTFNPKEVIIFDIYENNMYAIQQEIIIKQRIKQVNPDINITCIIGSVREKARLDEIMQEYKPSVVFHAAAHKHVPLVEDSPKEAIKNNVFGTYNTILSCIEHKVDKFILISTDKAVYPTNVMGATKRLCEMIVQSFKDNGVTKIGAVRFGNVLGSNGSVIPLFEKQIQNGGPVTVTDKNITRYFMTIPEAAKLVLQAGAYANKGDIFVLDMGQPVKILTLAENLIKLSGLVPYEDIQIEFTGLRPGEKMYEELSLGNEVRYKTKNNLIYVNEPMNISQESIAEKIKTLESAMDLDNHEVKQIVLGIID
ncbi:MAG: nucleoside-diphosphate sugar epimerase/dehydratase [Erysipelotrichaceae bacterium]|nr:nucleoside-diphosphate sugar epimerase/dehydratase [Erysipelotrichaceae bacterium]